MWKLAVGFVVFAAVVLFAMKRFGGDLDLSGEKHGVEVHPAASAPAVAASQ